jgi:quinate dehydrogenase
MATQTQTQQTVVPDSSHVEKHGYLFGYPIAHSFSPLFHQTVYDDLGLNWSQLFLESTDMDLFLRLRQDPKFYGLRHGCMHVEPSADSPRRRGNDAS